MKRISFVILAVFLAGITLAWAGNPTKLSWTAPTTNADGSPLTDLAGYKVYCGSGPGKYTSAKDIGLPTGNTYAISSLSLPDGSNYCVMTAYDTSGNESVYSSEVRVPLDHLGPAAPQGLTVN